MAAICFITGPPTSAWPTDMAREWRTDTVSEPPCRIDSAKEIMQPCRI